MAIVQFQHSPTLINHKETIMTSTVIALILFIILLFTLEMSLRLQAEVKRLKAENTGHQDMAQIALDTFRQDRRLLRAARDAAKRELDALKVALDSVITLAGEEAAMFRGRIDNLCEQLQEARRGRRHYYDEAATNANMIHALNTDVTTLRATLRDTQAQLEVAKDHIKDLSMANHANLSDMSALSALQQENKLDALCEVIKTLMQRGQLDDSAVASFGGRLSRAVQVYRKDRLKAISEEHLRDDSNALTVLLGL